jgi:ABC-type Mn2+/Zn2+ transport system ATPase subunit
MDLLRFDNVTLGYWRQPVLMNLNFSIRDGEFFGIVGAGGSGKTTLLRALLGILKPKQGEISVHVRVGESALLPEGGYVNLTQTPGAVRFGYVPQRDAIDEVFPLTAREFVTMGRQSQVQALQNLTARDHEFVSQQLAQVGLADVATRKYRELSSDQQQRLLLARALSAETHMLVLDEPAEGMSLENRRVTLDLLAKLHDEKETTVIYATRRADDLPAAAERRLVLEAGTGRVQENRS